LRNAADISLHRRKAHGGDHRQPGSAAGHPSGAGFGVEGRLPWLAFAVSGLPETTTAEHAKPERKVASYQHPDHDTPASWTPRI
jgi:hypothetical protein